MALYSALRGSVWGVPKWNVTGKIKAEPIDFIADVELKIKRVCGTAKSLELMQLIDLDRYGEFSGELQTMLGMVFKSTGLDVDGDYRMLFYRAKNNRLLDRDEPTMFPEQEFTAEDLLE
jgi:hypothetical protein